MGCQESRVPCETPPAQQAPAQTSQTSAENESETETPHETKEARSQERNATHPWNSRVRAQNAKLGVSEAGFGGLQRHQEKSTQCTWMVCCESPPSCRESGSLKLRVSSVSTKFSGGPPFLVGFTDQAGTTYRRHQNSPFCTQPRNLTRNNPKSPKTFQL